MPHFVYVPGRRGVHQDCVVDLPSFSRIGRLQRPDKKGHLPPAPLLCEVPPESRPVFVRNSFSRSKPACFLTLNIAYGRFHVMGQKGTFANKYSFRGLPVWLFSEPKYKWPRLSCGICRASSGVTTACWTSCELVAKAQPLSTRRGYLRME
jgi:hypothetical protein